MLLPKDENNVIDPNAAELSIIPDYDYSAADFCTPEPYEKLYELHKTPFLYEISRRYISAPLEGRISPLNSVFSSALPS